MAMPQHAMRAARPGTARPLPARVQHAGAPAQPQGRSPLHVCFAAAREPLSAKVLNSIISTTDVPYSSYISHPRTPMHYIDARIKQLWLFAILLIIPRAPWEVRLGLVGLVVLCSVVCLPARLWKAQMGRLSILAALLFVGTTLFSEIGQATLIPRGPPANLIGLPALADLNGGYKCGFKGYVLFKFFTVTITRFSLSLALSVASIAFAALQVTALFLVTTPPEEMALAFRWFLAPLRLLGVPVQKLTMTLLLSLRFVSLVFDEVRNLTLGLAARSVCWEGLDRNGVLSVWTFLALRLFGNLFSRSRFIAESLVARGYSGPATHALNIPRLLPSNPWVNAAALAALAALVVSCQGPNMIL